MKKARQRKKERRKNHQKEKKQMKQQNQPKTAKQYKNDHIKQLEEKQKATNKQIEKQERKNGGIK